ncbi:MAG: ABC transporter ATP-binding protein [Candidatus Velthaea sp.]
MTALRLEHVAVARGSRTLLRDVSATFAAGEATAIVGANGVGKTSLLAVLAGVLAPAGGTIVANGTPLGALDPRTRARTVALVESLEPVLGAMTVAEAVAAARFPHHQWWEWQPTQADRYAVDTALERVEMAALRRRHIETLSAGERQRVWIAMAVAQQAEIILLDEPTSHLDLRYAVETLELLRALARGGAAVIAVLHLLEEAATFFDRVIVLGYETVLADGPPAAALTAATLERAYGIPVAVEQTPGGLTFHRGRGVRA